MCGAAPDAYSGVVPSGGEYGIFSFGPIYSEIVQRFVGIVEASYGHHNMPHPDVECGMKAFLDPELFQFNFTSFFGFGFPFAGFLELLFHGTACAGMLEFNLGLHSPALPEVESKIDYGMGYVKPAVLFSLVRSRGRITVHIVTVKIAGKGNLTIPANRKTLLNLSLQLCLCL